MNTLNIVVTKFYRKSLNHQRWQIKLIELHHIIWLDYNRGLLMLDDNSISRNEASWIIAVVFCKVGRTFKPFQWKPRVLNYASDISFDLTRSVIKSFIIHSNKLPVRLFFFKVQNTISKIYRCSSVSSIIKLTFNISNMNLLNVKRELFKIRSFWG